MPPSLLTVIGIAALIYIARRIPTQKRLNATTELTEFIVCPFPVEPPMTETAEPETESAETNEVTPAPHPAPVRQSKGGPTFAQNPFNVAVKQRWEDNDPRNADTQGNHAVLVVKKIVWDEELDEYVAICQRHGGKYSGRRTRVQLDRFDGDSNGYSRVS